MIKKVFISQPMNGKTDEEILARREELKQRAYQYYSHQDDVEIEFIDSFIEGAPAYANPIWYLGESIKKMSEADLIVFDHEWVGARGCRIERAVMKEYDIDFC